MYDPGTWHARHRAGGARGAPGAGGARGAAGAGGDDSDLFFASIHLADNGRVGPANECSKHPIHTPLSTP